MAKLLFEELSGTIRQTAFEVHRYFGSGFLEKVYENALSHRLRKKGHIVVQQKALLVRDEDGTVVGKYLADLFVDERVIVELKAARSLVSEDVAQTLNCLKATGCPLALLINFGSWRLEFKRIVGDGAHSVNSVHSVHSVDPSTDGPSRPEDD
jgi:GxxExxY protein